MKSILTISIAFPPKFDSEGLVVSKYFKYLFPASKGKFAHDVVTSAMPTLNMHYDPALEGAADGVRQIVEIPIYENKYINYVLRRLWPTFVFNPDSKYTFHWQWRSVIRQLRTPPDLLYSRAFPSSSTLMAQKLKRYYNVPWILHLSDLWADCPDSGYRGGAQKHNEKLERSAFAEADVITVTSNSTIRFFQTKYPELADRILLYPNVYDPEDAYEPKAPPPFNQRKLRIVHTGGLAGTRNPEPFMKALANLHPDIQQRLEVIFAGWVDRESRRIIERYDCDCFTYLGPFESYKQAVELQRTADVLLLIDFPVENPEHRVYFLSKLLDYQLSGRPILGVTDAGSECQNVIEHWGGHCFERWDSAGIASHLQWLVGLMERENSDYFAVRPLREKFDAKYNAERLVSLFENILASQSTPSGLVTGIGY